MNTKYTPVDWKERRVPFAFFVAPFDFFPASFPSFPTASVLDTVFLRVDFGFDSDSDSEFAVESEFRSLAVVARFL